MIEKNNLDQDLLEAKKNNTVCGINMKANYSLKNLLAIFFINFREVCCQGYINA